MSLQVNRCPQCKRETNFLRCVKCEVPTEPVESEESPNLKHISRSQLESWQERNFSHLRAVYRRKEQLDAQVKYIIDHKLRDGLELTEEEKEWGK